MPHTVTLELLKPAELATDDRILAAARALGASGGAASTRILATLHDPDAEPAQVAQAISLEPALAARVMKVANSAYYGQSGAIGTLDRALAMLGLTAVKGVAAAACLDRMLVGAQGATAQVLGEVARHSVATACAAQALARLAGRPDLAQDAFLGGLLHDIGVAVQSRLNPAGVVELARATADREQPADLARYRQLEHHRVGAGHERCALLAFEAWLLPGWLRAAAGNHHDPLQAPTEHRVLVSLVCVADRQAAAAGFSHPLEPACAELDPALLRAAGVSPEQLASVSAALPQEASRLIGAVTSP